MSPDKELELLNDLFISEGWKMLMEDVQKIYDAANDLSTCTSPDEFLVNKGKVMAMSYVLNYQAIMEASHNASD